VAAHVKADVAAISVDGREVVRVPGGGALVVTARGGRLDWILPITPGQPLVPLPQDDWALSRLVRAGSGEGEPRLPGAFFADPLDVSAFLRVDRRDGAYFVRGWHAPERDGPIDFRWTSEAESELLVPLERPLPLRVIVELRPAVVDDRDPTRIALTVNGTAIDRYAARPGRHLYEWRVPESAWRAGANRVVLEVTRLTRPAAGDQRLLGAAVTLVRLERMESGAR
jgi:hypothetical protein